MSGWQPGDSALCIKMGEWTYSGYGGPRAGEVHSVTNVEPGPEGKVYLQLEAWPDDGPIRHLFWCNRFRKIERHKPDAEDLRTIALLNSKPALTPVGGR